MFTGSIVGQAGIQTLDTVIVFVYLIGIMVIGILAGYKKNTSSEQFFLAGKSLKWPMIGAALFTANISTIHLVGLASSGFSDGIVVGNFEWMAAFCLIVLGLIFVPFYLRTKINTLPEFLEKRYNKTCRIILAVIAIWSALLVHIGVSLYAGAKVFDYFFGIPVVWSVIIIATITAIYTIIGGLKAVVVTDTIQIVLLLAGCILLTALGIAKLPGEGITSFAALKAAVKPDQMSMAHSLRDVHGNLNPYSWLTVMIGYHVLGIWYWCTDQTIVQKTLGAKDMRHGQLGAIFAGVLKILPLFFMVFPGVIAYVLFKGKINDPDDTLTVMIDHLLPVGIKGLFAAGLLAAVMSTVEAALNSTATVTAEDLCKHVWPNLRDKTLVLIGRITACVVIVLAMIWSPYCGKFANIFVVINKVPMMFAPAITTVFVLGVFWRRGTKQAAVATFAVGLLIGLPYFIYDLPRNKSASDVQKSIVEYRLSKDKVVEQWVAGPLEDMKSLIAVSSGSVVQEWDSLPVAIKSKAREFTQSEIKKAGKKDVVTRDAVIEGWAAVPKRYVQAALTSGQLASGKVFEVWASAPLIEVEAALASGQLLDNWFVVNYENVTHGIGIPFMMMGILLLCTCIVVYVVVSFMTPAPTAEDLAKVGWEPPLRAVFGKKLTGITDSRMIAVGLFLLMGILYYWLR